MSQYTAGSLGDVAQMFEKFASTADDMAKHASTKRSQQFELGRASAWRDAAQMLRKTVIEPKP